MNVRERNREVRRKAVERAKETWIAETSTGVVVLVHPGQSTDILKDPDRLRREFGVMDPSIVGLLSDSASEAPREWDIADELAAAEVEVARLRVLAAQHAAIDGEVIAKAEQKVAEIRADGADAE
jgi:hypothetical protein